MDEEDEEDGEDGERLSAVCLIRGTEDGVGGGERVRRACLLAGPCRCRAGPLELIRQ